MVHVHAHLLQLKYMYFYMNTQMLCYTLLVSGYAVFTSFLPLPAPNPPTHFPRFLPPPVHTYSSPGEGPLYLIKFLHWTPALSNEATLSHIKVEHVHNVVDGLDLLNLSNQKIHAYYVHENEYMYMQDTVFRVIFVFQEKLFGELNIITMNSLSCSQAACNSICTIRNTGYSGIN